MSKRLAVTRYYHGGPRGLRRILPPSRTGAASTRDYGGIAERDKVYVTTSYTAACMYAAHHDRGAVYLVRPVGDLAKDPDCSDEFLAFECDSAEVVRSWKLSETKRQRILATVHGDRAMLDRRMGTR